LQEIRGTILNNRRLAFAREFILIMRALSPRRNSPGTSASIPYRPAASPSSGSEPEIYFYVHRHAASGYIYMYDISSAAVHAAEMKREMLREVEAARPEFIVDVHDRFSWSGGFSLETQRIHEWSEQYLKSGNYRRVAAAENVNDKIVCRFNSDAVDYLPSSEFYICVYQRNL